MGVQKMAKKTETAISTIERDINLMKQEKIRVQSETEELASRVEETQKSMLNMVKQISNSVDYLQASEKENKKLLDEHDQLRKTYDELWEKKEAERNSVALIDKTLLQKQNERVQLEKTSAAEIKLLKL